MMDVKHRATRAKAILEDDLFKEAFSVLECTQIGVFTNPMCSAEQIMEAHRMVRALRDVKAHLENVIADGKLFERREEKKGQHRG
jgi:hypothetical protein